MKEPTVTLKWTTTSPEPHSVTMRNQLEPQDVFVEIPVPVEEQYLVNYKTLKEHRVALARHRELEIKSELSADIESAGEGPGDYPEMPVLTLEGMNYVISQLSGANELEPVEEEFDDNWEDDTVSKDDTTSEDELNEDDFEDDDFNWEDE